MATPTKKINTLKACDEVLFVSTKSSEEGSWNVSSWDVRTGNQLQTHRHGAAAPQSLCLLEGECVLAASQTKPVIHVWNMLRQGQKHRKLICGSKVATLDTSPDSKWIAAGMEDKIYIWQTCSGELYSVLSHSSVEVTKVKFTPSGQHLVAAYKDGSVCVWELQEAVTFDPRRLHDVRPVHTYRGHSGEVTDLHLSVSGTIVTCGTDFSVRVWSVQSSEELKMFELGAPVTAVVMDHSELTLYAGDNRGNVFALDLHYRPEVSSVHIDVREARDGYIVYPAHSGCVRCLCLTQDSLRMVSASDDMTVKVWSLISPLHPITIDLNEQVCDILVVPIPHAMVDPDTKPQVSLMNLKRSLHEGEGEGDYINMRLPGSMPTFPWPSLLTQAKADTSEVVTPGKSITDLVGLKDKAHKLKRANQEIFQFAVKEIIK